MDLRPYMNRWEACSNFTLLAMVGCVGRSVSTCAMCVFLLRQQDDQHREWRGTIGACVSLVSDPGPSTTDCGSLAHA
jgi:hypothetical protein